jgi:hypothetical protein
VATFLSGDFMHIRIVGLKERSTVKADELLVDTTSKSETSWTTDLSPFHLGPCPLYDGYESKTMENAWQFAKCYHDQLDVDGNPSPAYWGWAMKGWANPHAVRYPRGKGAKPAYLWWQGQKLSYIEARLQVYWSLYRDAARKTAGFSKLKALASSGARLVLFDFDGYDHEARNQSLVEVMNNDTRPMGHAFVLKAMLLYGDQVTAEEVGALLGGAEDSQGSLF